jgi:pimeloyl-ACP methyl ester carboxylesterase
LVGHTDDLPTIPSADFSTRGGFVVWRAAQWHPDLVTHVFSVCTPYAAPQENFISTEDLVKGPLPQFAYQLHLASGEVEKSINDEQSIRQFLKGMYGGKGPDGEVVFVPEKGVLPENLAKVGDNRLLNRGVSDDLLDFCGRRRRGGRSTMNAYGRRRSLMLGRASRGLPAGDVETAAQQECCRIWWSLHGRRERPRRSACCTPSSMGHVEIDCTALFQKEHLTLNKR